MLIDTPSASPDSPNITIMRTLINIYNCPSDSSSSPSGLGGTNYAGSRGVEYRNSTDNGVIAFWSPQPTGLQDVLDGSSSTAIMAECVRGLQYQDARDAKGTIFETPDSLLGSGTFAQFAAECHELDPRVAVINDNARGANWVAGGYGDTLYNHTLTPNDHSCLSSGMVQEGAFTSGSRHVNGVNLLFVDGHISFLADSVSLKLWRALGTRSGSEVIDAKY
jgi:prepilin-type processing-associated H-X9-DG protein